MRGWKTKALSKEAPVSLVLSFLDWLQPLSCVMTTPTFDSFLTVLAGWVFARRHTVTGMILAADAVGTKHHSAYHRLFAAARWSLDELGLAVFALILPLLGDHLRGSGAFPILLGVDDKLAFCGERFFCLPILFRLYVPKKTADKKGLPYYTKPQLAVQMLQLLCGRFENRQFHAVGDSTYGGKSVLCKLPRNCGLTSRLKMDARLYDAPPARGTSRKG